MWEANIKGDNLKMGPIVKKCLSMQDEFSYRTLGNPIRGRIVRLRVLARGFLHVRILQFIVKDNISVWIWRYFEVMDLDNEH